MQPTSDLLDFFHGVEAKHNCHWIQTSDEHQTLSGIFDICQAKSINCPVQYELRTWSVSRGPAVFNPDWIAASLNLQRVQASLKPGHKMPKNAFGITHDSPIVGVGTPYMPIGGATFDEPDVEQVFDLIQEEPKQRLVSGVMKQVRVIWVLIEFDEFLENPVLRRKFKELCLYVTAHRNAHISVLTASTDEIPRSLDGIMSYINVMPPSDKGLNEFLTEQMAKMPEQTRKDKFNLSREDIERLSTAGAGLSINVFRRAIYSAVAKHGKLTIEGLEMIAEQKRNMINNTGFLQYTEAPESLESVGGQDLLKSWLRQRMLAFDEKARAYGLPEPKGVLVVGAPGCGKSLGAKAAAATWKRPIIRLDVGALFGGLVGESESNMRKAISLIETVSPCVLWIDEIEKGLSGMGSSGNTDGGTTSRVFQSLLTWLAEKRSAVFVYATANDPSKLPPELLRKGRMDEIFSINLPVTAERKQIFKIHLQKRGRSADKFDLDALATETKTFSGAEIEQAVVDAMFSAYYNQKEIETEDILAAAKATNPMAQTMRERIEAMEHWAKTRTRPSSSLSEIEPTFTAEIDNTVSEFEQLF